MFGWFFNRSTTLQLTTYPQDASGGTLPTASQIAVLVPCCVQQDTPPEKTAEGQYRKGSVARVRVFFGSSFSATPDLATQAVLTLTRESRVVLDDGRTLVLIGPPYDEAGKGAYYIAECRIIA